MRRGGKRKSFLPGGPPERTVKKEMAMTRILARVTVLVFAVTMSISAFAGSTKTDNITLYHDAQLNGTTIPAGEYTVKCETNGSTAQVKVMKGGKEVATASGQAKELGQQTAARTGRAARRRRCSLHQRDGFHRQQDRDHLRFEHGQRREVETRLARFCKGSDVLPFLRSQTGALSRIRRSH